MDEPRGARMSIWTAVIFTSAVHAMVIEQYDVVTILAGSSVSANQQAETKLDCRQVAALNLTINVTDVRVLPGDIFYIYHQLSDLDPKNIDFLFIDQTVIKRKLLSVLLSSTTFKENSASIVTVERYDNSPYEWCCLTNIYGQPSDTRDANNLNTDPYSTLYDFAVESSSGQLYYKRAKVIQEIVRSLRWENILLLYQDIYEAQVRTLTDLLSLANVVYRLVNLERNATLERNIMMTFEDTDDFHAVIIASLERAQIVMELVQVLENKLGKRISVTGSSQWLLFSQAGRVTLNSWLFQSQFDNIALICEPYDLTFQLGVTWQSTDVLSINTLMYTDAGRRLSTVGEVDRKWHLSLRSDIFPNVKFGFNGRRFIVTTNSWPPYVYKDIINGTAHFRGFCMDLADELSRTLNFTIMYTEPPDLGWGAAIGNGSWTGMVGQILRQEVDVIIAPIGVTGAREKVIDFTFAFFYDDTAVIMKKPDPEKSKWRTYIDIFKREVLMCIGAALVLGALVIFFLEWGVSVLYGTSPKTFAKTYLGSLSYLLGAMLNQGGRNLPTSNAGRLFISSWWLFCLVVAGTYSGNLIAVLTVTKDKPPFDTVAEMASQDEYKFGTLGNSMWTTLFETSPRPEFQAVNRKIKAYAVDDPTVLAFDPYVHLEKVKAGHYAYIADKGMFDNWLAYNCDLMLLKEKFFPAKYAIGLPNNSVYTNLFSDQVVKIYESGLLQVWIKRWWPKRSFCGGSLVTEAKTLTLIDMQSSFYLLGIGMVLGGLALMVEFVYSRAVPRWHIGTKGRNSTSTTSSVKRKV